MNVMTRITLLRHAEATHNITQHERVGGRSNHAPLTPEGRKQAQRFGSWLAKLPVSYDAIYASPAVRTLETLKIALGHAGISLPIHRLEGLQELSQGRCEGMLRAGVWTEAELARMYNNPLHLRLPDGENHAEVRERMLAAVDEIARAEPNGNVLACTHGLAIRNLVGAIEDLPHQEVLRLTTPNVSLTELANDRDGWHVESIGRMVIDY